jgi:predicted GIY-YIG superfamily endonuclease
MNGKIKPYSQTSKYLGMTLDAKLRWKVHVKEKKRKAWSKIQTHVLAYGKAIGHVNTSTHNKLVLYKQILKPV